MCELSIHTSMKHIEEEEREEEERTDFGELLP